MMYMLMVDVLVASVVFGLAGTSILILLACIEGKRAMQRIAPAVRREFFVISRRTSRSHDRSSFRIA